MGFSYSFKPMIKAVSEAVIKIVCSAQGINPSSTDIISKIGISALDGISSTPKIESPISQLKNLIMESIEEMLRYYGKNLSKKEIELFIDDVFNISTMSKISTCDNPEDLIVSHMKELNLDISLDDLQLMAEGIFFSINRGIRDKQLLLALDTNFVVHELLQRLPASNNVSNNPFITHRINIEKNKEEFVGRDTEMKRMEDILERHGKVFICGVGGIGKSELALQYIEKHRGEFNGIARVFYRGDIESNISFNGSSDEHRNLANLAGSIMQDIEIVDFDYMKYGDTDEERFQFYYKKLQRVCHDFKILIFIDNYNTDNDPYISDILNLNCKIIIASRHNFEKRYENFTLMIDEIENMDDLNRLFCLNGPKKLKNDLLERSIIEPDINSKIKELIEIVGRHTLTIVLLAKQLRSGQSISLDEMTECLKSEGVVFGNVINFWHGRDGRVKYETLYSHIWTIFNFSEMGGGRRATLGLMAYIPPSGIERTEFLVRCWSNPSDGEEYLNRLIDGGWIQEDEISQRIMLHPIISEIVWRKMVPRPGFESRITLIPEYYGGFLADLENKLRTAKEKNVYIEQADFFAGRIWENSLIAGDALYSISNYLNEQGQYNKSTIYAIKALKIFQETYINSHIKKINCLIRIGINYIKFGWFKDALDYLIMAIDEFSIQGQLPIICCEKVIVYNAASDALTRMGRYNEALEYGLQANSLLKDFGSRNFGVNDINEDILNELILNYFGLYADNCDILSTCYSNIGLSERAISIVEEAVGLRQAMVYFNHPDILLDDDNFTRKEKDIFMRVYEQQDLLGLMFLNSDYVELAASCQILSSIYAGINQFEKSLKYCLRASIILREILPENHPDLETNYDALNTLINALGYDNAGELCNLNGSASIKDAKDDVLAKNIESDSIWYVKTIAAGMEQYLEIKALVEKKNIYKQRKLYEDENKNDKDRILQILESQSGGTELVKRLKTLDEATLLEILRNVFPI